MKRNGRNTNRIVFPLGGIGTGSIGLAGDGHLVDWEIFNRPDAGRLNGFTHFAVRAERPEGGVLDARVLQGDAPPHVLEGVTAAVNHGHFQGPGFGPPDERMAGWPHFRSWSFEDAFPGATLRFRDPSFPGAAALTAWSPFVPGESRASSMPVAAFDVALRNTTRAPLVYTAAAVLANPWWGGTHRNALADGGRTLVASSGAAWGDEFGRGDLALAIDPACAAAPGAEVSAQAHWLRGAWMDGRETYWRNLLRGGALPPRDYGDAPFDGPDHGALALRFPLAPGETRRVRFALAWCIPLRSNDWDRDADARAAAAGLENRWRNWYATQWPDARAALRDFFARAAALERGSRAFARALRATTLPAAVRDGAAASLCVLRSPTCLRLEDGTFYGWEGVGAAWGSCEGSCTHVWNYAQALPFLFPDLERSMRDAHLAHDVDARGAARFRLRLPLGRPASEGDVFPCADGQFGDVMKVFRDWKISGDDAWLRAVWPTVRRLLEFAWSPANPHRWDPDGAGLPTGRQHHTLDMELFGASGWIAGLYLGALLAARRMAEAVGDDAFAARCAAVFARGRARAAAELFDGDHFVQRIDLRDKAALARFGEEAVRTYWNDETGQIKYQLAGGVGIDGALGAFFAELWGVGEALDPAQVRAHLGAVLRDNFAARGQRDAFNPWRCFATDDERGVRIATWAPGRAPAIPLPYNTECMTGFEWTFAAHLALVGRTMEAADVCAAIRARFDGAKRNPFDEFECGRHYARSMAAWGLVPAWSGFRFDAGRGFLGFAPRGRAPRALFRSFWSLGSAWGLFEEGPRGAVLRLLHGAFDLRALALDFAPAAASLGRRRVPFSLSEGELRFDRPLSLRPGATLRLELES